MVSLVKCLYTYFAHFSIGLSAFFFLNLSSFFLYSGCALTLLLTSANYFCKWVYLSLGDNWEGTMIPLGDMRSHTTEGLVMPVVIVRDRVATLLLKSGEAVWERRRSRNHMWKGIGPKAHPNSLAGGLWGSLSETLSVGTGLSTSECIILGKSLSLFRNLASPQEIQTIPSSQGFLRFNENTV